MLFSIAKETVESYFKKALYLNVLSKEQFGGYHLS